MTVEINKEEVLKLAELHDIDLESQLAEIIKQEMGELANVQPLDGDLFKDLMEAASDR